MTDAISFAIPLRTKTGLNSREHHFARAKRVERERSATRAAFLQFAKPINGWFPLPPFLVTLTRVGPRPIDRDNAVGALKGVRDEIALMLGVDDGDEEKIYFRYRKEIGPFSVQVKIEQATGRCPECGHALTEAA